MTFKLTINLLLIIPMMPTEEQISNELMGFLFNNWSSPSSRPPKNNAVLNRYVFHYCYTRDLI